MKDSSNLLSSPQGSPSQNKNKKNVSILSNEINLDNPEVILPLNLLKDGGNLTIELKKTSYRR